MGIKHVLEEIKKGLKKFRKDLEKESVAHGDHKPHCCTLPDEILYNEILYKEKESGKDKMQPD